MLILVGDRLLGVIFCEKGGYGTTWYEKDKSNYQKNVLLYHSQTYKVAEYLLSIPIYTCFEITCTKRQILRSQIECLRIEAFEVLGRDDIFVK